MKTTILFPCEYDNIHVVDDNFLLEYNACQSVGIKTALFDHDLFVSESKLKISEIDSNSEILLRSWMLKTDEYTKLEILLEHKLITNHWQYKYAHHFPEILQDIKYYTTPINCWFHLSDMNDELINIIQNNIKTDILIKDFVKSEKGTDLFIFEKDIIRQDLKNIIDKFVIQRGNLFNDGIVLKEFVELKKYGKTTNEWRAFYYDQNLISLELNTENNIISNKPDIKLIKEVGNQINKSKFYTIDFAELSDGTWKVLEAGDGQVSGLSPYQNEILFYNMLKKYLD